MSPEALTVEEARAAVEDAEETADALRTEAREADDAAEEALKRLAEARANGASEDEVGDLRTAHRKRRAEAEEASAAVEVAEENVAQARRKLDEAEEAQRRGRLEELREQAVERADTLDRALVEAAARFDQFMEAVEAMNQTAEPSDAADLRAVRGSVAVRRAQAYVLGRVVPPRWRRLVLREARPLTGRRLLSLTGIPQQEAKDAT